MPLLNSSLLNNLRNSQYYIDRLSDPFRTNGYFDMMKGVLNSTEMYTVIDFLTSQKDSGERFSPTLKQMFAGFSQTPLENLRVVFINSFPHDELGASNGLAFGTSSSKEISWKNPIYNLYCDISQNPDCEPSMEFLANQGVLLLNQSFTVPQNHVRKKLHQKNWSFFISYFLDMLNSHHRKVPVILFGNSPSQLADLLTEGQAFKICTPDVEKCKNVFAKVNMFLKDHGQEVVRF